MAALVAAFSLFCLTLPASAAWTGLNGGATSNGGFTLMGVPFGILSYNDQFAWRADLYVSANPDGKINKSDIIGSTQLPKVGSVFCASPQYAADSSWKTYIQTDYTNEDRGSFSSHGVTPGTLSYTLPTLKQFEPGADNYFDASGNTVAIADAGKVSLFDRQFKSPTDFDKIQKMHFIKNNILHNVEKRIKYRKMRCGTGDFTQQNDT